jgi:hypothetical protein
MATLAANSSVVLASFTGTERLSVVANHNQLWRWVFEPYATDTQTNLSPAKQTSRTHGPLASSIAIGPMGVGGNWTLWNDSSTSLTYDVLYANVTFQGITGTGAIALSPANQNVVISPTGTGTVTINPAVQGSMQNVEIGSVTRRNAGFTAVYVNIVDSSGTPGNVTNNGGKGRVAIAAGQSSIVVTNSVTNASASVYAVINQATADATLTHIVRTVPAAGSFTIYGNAAATANVVVDFIVFGA